MPARRRLSRAEQQEQTRARIMDAGLRLFAKTGMDNVSVDEIAEFAGYSRGALYSNFAGKDDLALSIMEERMADRTDQLRSAVEEDPEWWRPPRDRAKPDPWDVVFVELWSRAIRDEAVRRRLARQLGMLTDAIADGLAATRPRSEAEQLAPAALALLNGMAMQQTLRADAALFDAYEAAMTKLLGHS